MDGLAGILKSAWLQGGAVGLLTLSGWGMWWLERKARLDAERRAAKQNQAAVEAIANSTSVLNATASAMDRLTSVVTIALASRRGGGDARD